MFRLFEEDNPFKVEKSLKLLGLNVKNNQDFILNEISKYLFETTNDIIIGNSGERIFDLNYDYKYYFVDFLRYHINLNKDDIDWWEFNSILDGILLDDNSITSKHLTYRTYKKPPENPKTREEQQHMYMLQMKRIHSLPNKNQVENGLEKLWNYVEKKAGDKKE